MENNIPRNAFQISKNLSKYKVHHMTIQKILVDLEEKGFLKSYEQCRRGNKIYKVYVLITMEQSMEEIMKNFIVKMQKLLDKHSQREKAKWNY